MIKVFFSYAREDREIVGEFISTHMRSIERRGEIVSWVDREKLMAGDDWRAEIVEALSEADLIVLMLSASFFASEFIENVELPAALERRAREEARVVPVLAWPITKKSLGIITGLQIVPAPDAPVHGGASTPEGRYQAWVAVADEIGRVVDELTGLGDVPPATRDELLGCRAGLDPDDRPPRAAELRKETSRRGTVGYRWSGRAGAIHASPRGTFLVRGRIAALHDERGGCAGSLGFPVSDEIDVLGRGRCQRFEGTEDRSVIGVPFGASIYYRSGDRVAYSTTGRAGATYEANGGPAGPLGLPRGATPRVTSGANTPGWWQPYERGVVYVPEGGEAHLVLGAMADAHGRLGGVEGRFGFPVGPAVVNEGHLTQEFEGGAIAIPADPPSYPVIAAGSFREGHQEQFLALLDGRIFHRWAYDGGEWSVWRSFFDTIVRLPVRLTTLSSREGDWGIAVADGDDAAVRVRWYRSMDKTWSDWAIVPTPRPVVSLASSSYASDHQELFAVLDDGNLFHRWQWDDDWLRRSRWSWFGTPVPMSRVSCGSPEPGLLEVYALGVDRRLYSTSHRRGEQWMQWEVCAGVHDVVAHAFGLWRGGHRELFVALEDGRLLHRWWHLGGWTDWDDFQTPEAVVELATSSPSAGGMEVLVVTASGRLLRRWVDASTGLWDSWDDLALP
jgi:hypothetical protein